MGRKKNSTEGDLLKCKRKMGFTNVLQVLNVAKMCFQIRYFGAINLSIYFHGRANDCTSSVMNLPFRDIDPLNCFPIRISSVDMVVANIREISLKNRDRLSFVTSKSHGEVLMASLWAPMPTLFRPTIMY